MPSQYFARKPLSLLLEEMKGENRLRRILGPVGLTSLGVGCIIGAGIFTIIGKGIEAAGPALSVSFIVAGIACVLAALCYAELASMVPIAGSAYTYASATLGELFAWIIGWDLVLEYSMASSAVAAAWSGYYKQFLTLFGIEPIPLIASAPYAFSNDKGFFQTGGIINLPSLVISLIVTYILVKGIKESSLVNTIMVLIKVGVVLVVIAAGAFCFNAGLLKNFAPHGWTGISFFGFPVAGEVVRGTPHGVIAGAAIVFFAYIGFDSVSTHAEEAKNPQRDVPIGIVASLLICTILYLAVAFIISGMVDYQSLGENAQKAFREAPVAEAFRLAKMGWSHAIITLGALAGMTSVLLVLMLSLPRVMLALARDGLLPHSFFGAVHPKYKTPYKSTMLTGAFVALMAAFFPLDVLADLVNIGTLLAFVIVCAAVIVLRKTDPDADRPFRVKGGLVIPILGMAICLLLMFGLPLANWWRLIVWLGIGFVIYFAYGQKHSTMHRLLAEQNGEGK